MIEARPMSKFLLALLLLALLLADPIAATARSTGHASRGHTTHYGWGHHKQTPPEPKSEKSEAPRQ